MQGTDDVTAVLAAWQQGDEAALERLAPFIYDELHRIAAGYMRRERGGSTLQATALVNEAYLRLAGANLSFTDRSHFFALAARMMRRILVDHARGRRAEKRGGDAKKLMFDEAAVVDQPDDALLEFDQALEKLAGFDARLARAIELRFFGGMDHKEASEVLGVSVSTLYEDLKLAKAWLNRELA
ncbi:MAG: sigma-70 family RNA polymerase sigma factor [Woeseiaceae bacterium]|nr:sigma-70 family RNA polymerase sigma factor [Woeseiaceae bacterium]